MKKLIGFGKEFGISILTLVLPIMASAQATAPVTLPTAPINSAASAETFICTIINWLFYLLMVGAIVFIILAAFKYLTAGGDAEKVKAAGSSLLYAAVAVAVALLAKAIPLIVASFLGATVGGLGC